MVSSDGSSHLLIQPQVRHSEETGDADKQGWELAKWRSGGRRASWSPAPLSALPFAFLDPKTYFWFLVHSPLPVTLLFVFSLLLEVAASHITFQWEPSRLAEPLTIYILGFMV